MLWMIVGLVLLIIELGIMSLFLLWIALGAFAAGIVAVFARSLPAEPDLPKFRRLAVEGGMPPAVGEQFSPANDLGNIQGPYSSRHRDTTGEVIRLAHFLFKLPK